MNKIKIFKSVDSELMVLEKEINEWIAESKVKIIDIHGNISAQTPRGSATSFSQSDVLIIVHYQEA